MKGPMNEARKKDAGTKAGKAAPLGDTERLEMIIHAAQDTKALELVCFDMNNRSPITDYVFLCNGRSQAHVRGIADRILDDMKKAGIACQSLEGYQEGSWVLMDFDVVLVHVFHPETRTYYDLDGLLSDFDKVDIPEPTPPPTGN